MQYSVSILINIVQTLEYDTQHNEQNSCLEVSGVLRTGTHCPCKSYKSYNKGESLRASYYSFSHSTGLTINCLNISCTNTVYLLYTNLNNKRET